MGSIIDTLLLRRPKINYISPPVCEAIFSGSSFPMIILPDIAHNLGPTGLQFSGTPGNNILSWNAYPGALCYNVYTAVIEVDNLLQCEQLVQSATTVSYAIIAECINQPFFVAPPNTHCYRVSAILPDGETQLSDPFCSCVFPPPPIHICNTSQTANCVFPLVGSPVTIPAGAFCVTLPYNATTAQQIQAQNTVNSEAMAQAQSELSCSGGGGSFWDGLIWDTVFLQPGTDGTISGTFPTSPPGSATFVLSASKLGGGNTPPMDIICNNIPPAYTLLYTGGPVNCNLKFTVTKWTHFDLFFFQTFTVKQDGITRLNLTPASANITGIGVFNFPFSLIAGTNSVITVEIEWAYNDVVGPGEIDLTGTFSVI